MYQCADEKISKTVNKVTVAYCDVENLDHQNWQLLEGKSYITCISIIKPKISWKNGTGSGFGRKIGRDGGIEKKKRRESGIWEPLLWTLDRWSNILFAHDFTGTVVISSFPGAGPQCQSSEKKEQLILKMLSFFNMNVFQSVCENFVIRVTDRWNPKK